MEYNDAESIRLHQIGYYINIAAKVVLVLVVVLGALNYLGDEELLLNPAQMAQSRVPGVYRQQVKYSIHFAQGANPALAGNLVKASLTKDGHPAQHQPVIDPEGQLTFSSTGFYTLALQAQGQSISRSIVVLP